MAYIADLENDTVRIQEEDGTLMTQPRCPICEDKFQFRYQLHWHFHRKHSRQELVLFVCDECNQSFVHRTAFDGHCASVHGGSVSFACEKCGLRFVSDLELRQHHLSHQKARVYPSEIVFGIPQHFEVDKIKFFIGQKIPEVDVCRGCFNRNDFQHKHPNNHLSDSKYIKSMKRAIIESSMIPMVVGRSL